VTTGTATHGPARASRHRAPGPPDAATTRFTVRVVPSSKRDEVAGRYGSDDPPVLLVRVRAPAVDGKANEALLRLLASEVGIRPGKLRLVSGSRSRTKVVEIDGDQVLPASWSASSSDANPRAN